MPVCLSAFHKRKTAAAIDTKLGRPIVHVRSSACTDPDVKRLKVKVEVKRFIQRLQSLAATDKRRYTCKSSRLALSVTSSSHRLPSSTVYVEVHSTGKDPSS